MSTVEAEFSTQIYTIKHVTPEKLNSHLTDVHFTPFSLIRGHIARFDIEFAYCRAISLQPAAGDLIRLAQQDDEVLQSMLQDQTGFTPNDYRLGLVRNIRYMDMLGVATIDWVSVEKLYPGAASIGIKPDELSSDSFPHDRMGLKEARAIFSRY